MPSAGLNARVCFPICLRRVLLAILVSATIAHAEELLPADRSIPEVIDHYVKAELTKQNVVPAPIADDANLLRRTMLDLVGRPPLIQEVEAYVADPAPEKRSALVERLVNSPAFIRHNVNEFDALLMRGSGANLRNYLQEAMTENRSWDRIFRELLLGIEGDAEQKKGGLQFIKARASDIDRLTTDVSSLFFGVNVSCAKCHDHPLVPDWKQDHYYGMKSFFERTFVNGDFVAEKEYGLGKFKTVGGEERTAKVMFLTGASVEEPAAAEPNKEEEKAEKQKLEELKKNKQPPPPPTYSRRAKLVELALQPEQSSYFARSIVNHLWNRLYGRGLVMPVDQLHSENPASHPELLAWLARDLQSHGYDLKRLIHGLVLSKTYAHSSRSESASPTRPELFAVAMVRPLSPTQFGTTLRLASANPEEFPLTMPADEFDRRMQQMENSGRGLTESLELPYDDFQISVDEALYFSNNDRPAKELLRKGKESLLGKLSSIGDPGERASLAVRCALAREPQPAEVQALREYFEQRADRSDAACEQVVWSLLMSSELRFNY